MLMIQGHLLSNDSATFKDVALHVALVMCCTYSPASTHPSATQLTAQTMPYILLCYLKVGTKRLYLADSSCRGGGLVPSDALCLLDFYTHHSCQRQGIGVKLFNAMLEGKGYTI
eukprot:1534-Heterococcus_DN1.PRE.1